ncbi:hypothetical protein KEJ39_06685 [Candidatus Bathyarchaeota archaeon]|nr:hypothetical protein [Candidatus Bathyarchaeota archaeon]
MAKVSLYINKEVWAKFREEVFRKHGSLRKLSSEVEALLSSTLVEDKVTAQFEKLGFKTAGAISSRELRERRPALRGPPSERIIREMRRKRVAETLPRQ